MRVQKLKQPSPRRLLSALKGSRPNAVRTFLAPQALPLLEELFHLATPLQERMVRNSREKLRMYRTQNSLKEHIANRRVVDRFLPFDSALEAALDEAIDDYVRNSFFIEQRSSGRFVAGIYRRRLTSSLPAFVQSRQASEGYRESFLDDEDDDLTSEEIAIEDAGACLGNNWLVFQGVAVSIGMQGRKCGTWSSQIPSRPTYELVVFISCSAQMRHKS